MIQEKTRNQDIRNILVVLGSAVFCACLLAGVFLYYYNPSGRYDAGNTLLDPAIIDSINYQDVHPSTGAKIRYSFDNMEFSYVNSQNKNVHLPLEGIESYQAFYSLVGSLQSIVNVGHEIQTLFLKPPYSVLTINLRSAQGNSKENNKVFQVVQFVPEDYFRVQLHGKNDGEWAYFYQPGLYQKIMELFTRHSTL